MSSYKVAKIFVKQDPEMSLKPYILEIERIRSALEKNENVQTFRSLYENDRVGVIIRQYVFSNLYDRLSTRPLLNSEEKRWIIFQLVHAVAGCHSNSVCHGDIKLDNVLLTSWNWVFLTDFASFKPTRIPVDNPAAFSFFFDTSGRQSCYIAPERFYIPDSIEGTDAHICRFDGQLLPAMDIFSLGCVIYELMTDGKALFNLGDLLDYRQGKLDLSFALNRIADPAIRGMVAHMVSVDPGERLSALEYLQRHRGTVFPNVFYSFLHQYMRAFVAPQALSPDDKILKLYADLGKIKSAFTGAAEDAADHGTRFVIVGSLVAGCVRSLSTTSAKLTVLKLLLEIANVVLDEYKIDRILPFINALLGDHVTIVRVAAVRALVKCVGSVSSVRGSDLNLFPGYILPTLSSLATDPEVLVRVAYAENIALLAETAQRILETAQLALMRGPKDAAEGADEDEAEDEDNAPLSFDLEMNVLRDAFEEDVKRLLTDHVSVVKQAILACNISKLCTFFGPRRASDVLLSHMLTFFNDKRDWRLRMAFFEGIVPVATYCGRKSLELFILPIMEKCLADVEEFVVKQAIDSITATVELRLLDRTLMLSLAKDIVPLLQHPSIWIRYSAGAFVAAVAKNLSSIDRHCGLTPLVEAFTRRQVTLLDQEAVLLSAVRKPLPRQLYQAVISCRDLSLLYDALLLRKMSREKPGSAQPRTQEVSKKQNEIFSFLVKNGLTLESEALVLRLEAYIQKVVRERRSAAESGALPGQDEDASLDLVLRKSRVDIHAFDPVRGTKVDKVAPTGRSGKRAAQGGSAQLEAAAAASGGAGPAYNGGGFAPGSDGPSPSAVGTDGLTQQPQGMAVTERSGRRGKLAVQPTVSTVRNTVTGVSQLRKYIEADVAQLAALSAKARVKSQAPDPLASVKGKKAKAAAEARDRDTQATKLWRPDGRMVGHLGEHKAAVNKIVVSPDQRFFATASDDGSVRFWDCGRLEGRGITNESRQQFTKQSGKIKHIAIGESSQSLVSASNEGTILVTRIELANGTFSPLVKRTADPALGLGPVVDVQCVGPGGNIVVYAMAGGHLCGWDLRTRKDAWVIQGQPSHGLISGVVVDSSQNWLTYGTSRGVYTLCDLRFQLPVKSWLDTRGTAVGNLQLYPECCTGSQRTEQMSTALDPSSWVFAAGGNNDVALWDLKTSTMVSLFVGTPQPQDIDQGMLQSSLDVVNGNTATNIKSVKTPRTALQIFEQDRLAKQAEGIKHQRLLWSQLKPADQQRYIVRQQQDAQRYEDELTEVLSKRWSGPALRTHTPGMRCLYAEPKISALFMGSSDGHIRIWDLDRPHTSYLLGETTRPPASGSARTDFTTTYGINVKGDLEILTERLGHETRSKSASVPTASRGPIAPIPHHSVGINSLAVVTSPSKFLLSASRDGVVKVWK